MQVLLAPAKINLHLRVGPVQSSGFHPLLSWMCTIGLFDILTIRARREPGIALTCDDPAIPCDRSNLVVRAAIMLSQLFSRGRSRYAGHTGLRHRALISLQKRIPAGGGLGGGSSDAARALLGLNNFWHLRATREQLAEIAASVGSDVSFFLHAPSSICRGRGEIVTPVQPPRTRWALLFLPRVALATGSVYQRFDELKLGQTGFATDSPPWHEWAALSAGSLLPRLVNDLEPAAFAISPRLGELRDALESSLSRVIRMSGSGSTLFTLFDERAEADAAAALAQAAHPVDVVVAEVAPRIVDDLNENTEAV